jgi:hypothetical protein
MINAKGHETVYSRDEYNRVDTTNSFYNVDLSQSQTLLSAGARYRFSKNTYFTVNWVNQTVKFKEVAMRNYNINQIFFNYTMIF